jgi:hypothetical protein
LSLVFFFVRIPSSSQSFSSSCSCSVFERHRPTEIAPGNGREWTKLSRFGRKTGWPILSRTRAFSQKPDDFPSFSSRVSGAGRPFLDQIKVPSKQFVELFPGHRERWPPSLGRFPRVPGIQEKDGQQSASGLQSAKDSMDILEASPRFDRAKAGVLKNPLKTVCQFNGKIKKVLQFVGLVTGKSELASSVQRTRRYIQADDLASWGGGCDGPNIISESTTWHQDAALHRASTA